MASAASSFPSSASRPSTSWWRPCIWLKRHCDWSEAIRKSVRGISLNCFVALLLALTKETNNAQRNSSRYHPASWAHADHRPHLSARDDGDRRRHLPETGAGQPDREGRQGRWLRSDRARVQGRQIFPRPALGDHGPGSERFNQDGAGALQRRQFRRLHLGPTSKALADRMKEDVDKLKAEN